MHPFMHHTVFALSLALLLPGALMAGEMGDQTKTRKEAIQLTERIENSARKIQTESEHLRVMQKGSSVSNFTHQYKLHLIANEVNEQLQPAFKRLVEIQPALPAWHSDAVDRMHTSAMNLAANTKSAVLNRGFSGKRLPVILDSEYGQLLQNINDQAATLVQMADAAGDYGDAQLKGHRAGLAITSHD